MPWELHTTLEQTPKMVYFDFTSYGYRATNIGINLSVIVVDSNITDNGIIQVPIGATVDLYEGIGSPRKLVSGNNNLMIPDNTRIIKIERIPVSELPPPWEKLIHLPQVDLNVYLDFTRYNYRAANNSTNTGILYKNGVSVGSFTNTPAMLLESNGFTQGDNVLRSVNTGVRSVYIEQQLLNKEDNKPWEAYHYLEIRTNVGFDPIYFDFDDYDYRITPIINTASSYLLNIGSAIDEVPQINRYQSLHTWEYVKDSRALYIGLGRISDGSDRFLKNGINYLTRPSTDPQAVTYVIERREIGGAPDLKLNINGVVKEMDKGWVNINGQLKEIDKMWTNINGVLKEV